MKRGRTPCTRAGNLRYPPEDSKIQTPYNSSSKYRTQTRRKKTALKCCCSTGCTGFYSPLAGWALLSSTALHASLPSFEPVALPPPIMRRCAFYQNTAFLRVRLHAGHAYYNTKHLVHYIHRTCVYAYYDTPGIPGIRSRRANRIRRQIPVRCCTV